MFLIQLSVVRSCVLKNEKEELWVCKSLKNKHEKYTSGQPIICYFVKR